ncbi:MAG: UvrD-helicase domain-containing protein [Pseudomonadota bacterium]|nr:UvrD-helicase domain-containing protein [Pseudomonadota bacterium]
MSGTDFEDNSNSIDSNNYNKPPNFGYLGGLNSKQLEAVEAVDGAVLVLAGAGTGKTRVLTARLAHLIAQKIAQPWSILAVTFTNKAAREMRDRVTKIIGPMAEQVWLGTFHSLGARILRRHAELVDLKPNFTILDTEDQIRLIKQIMQAEGLDEKKWPPRVLAGVIQRWKDRGLTPEKVSDDEAKQYSEIKLAEVYSQYQNRLSVLNAADFGDLLLHCLTIFQNNPDILRDYQNRLTHLLVDEYQDTNVAQYLWLRFLAQGRQNICCVGDDDQSIYGWRGAEVGNILRFENDFVGSRVIRLEQNYRSTSRVLSAASGLIAHNEGRLGKTLWTNGNDGDKIIVRSVWDGEAEARIVGDQVEAYQRKGVSLNEMAILVRASFQTREFEERFLTLGVPYQVIGGARFYERMEIRDAIAYLRVIYQPDDDLALERIINKPKRGIGLASLQSIHQLARLESISLWLSITKIIETDELRPAARKNLTMLVNDFTRWRSMLENTDHIELTGIVLDESGYTEMLLKDKSPEAPGRLENLKELISALEEFDGLSQFLEHISLVMENAEDDTTEQISLMTLHAAKGLEFDKVFLPGWEEGVFPNQRSLDESGAKGLEEERRLAYVGLTRARETVEISFAANRRIYGNWQSSIPSRFVSEIPQSEIEHFDEMGISGDFFDGTVQSEPWNHVGLTDQRELRTPQRRGNVNVESIGPSDNQMSLDDRSSPEEIAGHIFFAPGDRVFHQKFGMGTVRQADGDKLEIAFDKAGNKKVISRFVRRL